MSTTHVSPDAQGNGGTLSETQAIIAEVCDGIKDLLLAKNREYGDAAVHPLRIFSFADAEEQIKVRIDDKISRIIQSRKIGESNLTIKEDTVRDLIGYFILMIVAREVRERRDAEARTQS